MAYEIKKFDINGEKLLYHMVFVLGITERAGKRLIDKGRVKLNGEIVAQKGVRGFGIVEVLFYEPTPTNQLFPVFECDDFAVALVRFLFLKVIFESNQSKRQPILVIAFVA